MVESIKNNRGELSMSLAMALYNHHGIVMSADKLITSTIKDGEKEIQYTRPSTEQKLFLIEEKYGLSCTGTASINGIPISAILEKYFVENSIQNLDIDTWLLNLANHFHAQLDGTTNNIIFIICGYQNNHRIIASTNTLKPSITLFTSEASLTYSGENQFVDLLINSPIIPFEYSKFTMQDSVDFLCFLNETVANLMHFGQYSPTVSKECDILAIYPNKSYWVRHETLHIPHSDS